ncbi:MAG: TspO/MBR family protein [Pseudomonadota bacterium]
MPESGSFITLSLFALLNLLAASSGAIFKPGTWYEALQKPSWTPPNWAFPVIWTIVFAMITAAGWLVWEQAGIGALGPLLVYLINLALNAAWSGFFFGARRMDLALIDVGLLWLSIVALILLFAPISTLAAGLLLPYLIWVSIAAFLNLRVMQMNRTAPAA